MHETRLMELFANFQMYRYEVYIRNRQLTHLVQKYSLYVPSKLSTVAEKFVI